MNTTLSISRRHAGSLLAGALAAVALPGWAQEAYPSKPIHLVVPFSAGGAVDTVGRTVGDRLSKQMNQPIIVDNKPGASANLGAEFVARANPDGYTLLVAANTSGGVVGKMISPQNLAIAATAVGLVGKESDIFRRSIPWSLGLLAALCLLVGLQSTPVLAWMMPTFG